MLALRPGRSWITRLGLVAVQRGLGVGKSLMRGLLASSDALGIRMNMLEVIKGNQPAHNLFIKLGFQEQRELLILRRAPAEVETPTAKIHWMERGEILFHLGQRKIFPAWTNQTESLGRAKGISGFKIYTEDDGQGWFVFQRTLFNISRIMFGTQYGDKHELMRQMLLHLHTQYPKQDTYTENIPAEDPHLSAFHELGYFEAFRRVEMHRHPDVSNFT